MNRNDEHNSGSPPRSPRSPSAHGTGLFRAASEPDLTQLPELPLFQLAEISDAAAMVSAGPSASPRSSPRRSPSSPRPTGLSQAGGPSVSFSEYVASELARDSPPPSALPLPTLSLDVTGGRQPRGSPQTSTAAFLPVLPPPAMRSESDGLARFLAPTAAAPDAPASPLSLKSARSARSFSSEFSGGDGEEPPRLTSLEPKPMFGLNGRQVQLSCYEIGEDGEIVTRYLTRSEILHEARETLHESDPSPVAAAQLMVQLDDGNAPRGAEMDDLASFINGLNAAHAERMAQSARPKMREDLKKYLRKYLRNSLQARDIRQVDPAFVAKPALWVRHTALVVSMADVRAIILRSKLFLFEPENPRTQQAAQVAQQMILSRPDIDNPQPFEFRALEGILIHVVSGLERDFNCLKPKIEQDLQQLPNQLTTKRLEDLRLEKQRLNQFHSRATIVQDILEKVLDEDEDMANMYLTEKHTSPNRARNPVDHDELEMLLEAYLQSVDELVNHSTLLNNGIEDTEDLVMIHLDTLRNRLLSVELALSVVSMTFGFGGLVAGMFGMNLPIPPFDEAASTYWFLAVVLGILFFVVSVSWLVLRTLQRRGLYSFP